VNYNEYRARSVRSARRLAGALALGLASIACNPTPDEYALPDPPVPEHNAMTAARVELGRMLFFDPRLSGSNWISCASCHNPGLGWADGLPTGLGHNMQPLSRNTPTIINVAYNASQFWDGRAASLEEQALGPIGAPGEMHQDVDDLLKEIENIPGYKTYFKKAYPHAGITAEAIAGAIASFERTIVSRDAPFDRWRAGDPYAISVAAQRGFELFRGKAQCEKCHSGPNFTDDGFHNIGVRDTDTADPGRFEVTPLAINRGAFKTPGLRDIERTAPYMHNGMYATLAEVVDHYDRSGDVNDNLDPNMSPLRLDDREKRDLVAFLRSLSGTPIEAAVPALPQ
jgi:cytochrome c peroxidase